MANSNLKTLSEIFNDKIFKIPVYQRGYSWGESQLEDLWRDIDNLPLDKSHYTGMITVDIQDNDVYHVVDGQQRLTSLIIFLNNIINQYQNDWIAKIKKDKVIEKYLYEETENSKNPKIKFGYYKDNSSYYYYKTKILNIEDKTNKNHKPILYTKNLNFSNNFFKNKLINKTQNELEELFIKLSKQLKFNWYEIEKTDDLDEYVIFETMNNRGKPLSVLEILKNRLMYITTLIDNINYNDKKKLRDDINDVWKTIFEYLGKDKRMDEEEFLKYHIAMYWGTSEIKSSDFYRNFLLDKFFSVKKVLNKEKENFKVWQKWYDEFNNDFIAFKKLESNEKNRSKIRTFAIKFYNLARNFTNEIPNFRNRFEFISSTNTLEEYLEFNIDTTYFNNGKMQSDIFHDKEYYEYYVKDIAQMLNDIRQIIDNGYLYYDSIESYTSSLKDSIKSYYFILNPQKSNYDDDIKYWLEKLNIMGAKEFIPTLISVFNSYKTKDKEKIIIILQYIENYLFVKRYCWGSEKTQYLNSQYYKITNEYENIKNIDDLIYEFEKLIYTNNIISTFNKKDKFIDKIKEFIEDEKGYYSWYDGLKYVLFEYEIYLQEQYHGESKILWKQINKESIEHIYPQKEEGTWRDYFNNINSKQRKKYVNALGNLLLLSPRKNSKASNENFDKKKEIYSSGSFNEIEVSKYDKWTTKEIDERSEKILEFMNTRWHLGLKVADISKLK